MGQCSVFEVRRDCIVDVVTQSDRGSREQKEKLFALLAVLKHRYQRISSTEGASVY